MSIWSRIANVFRGDRLNREIDEELESHIEEAIAAGRDPEEVRRAFGSMLRQREASHGIRVARWLEALRSDVIFSWRQLKRNRATSAAAVLSLALAMGSSVAAFRLIDALLWRPLPVANAPRLYSITRVGTGFDGNPFTNRGWAYPSFALMRTAIKGEAELIAVSDTERTDLTYKSDEEMEKAQVQYVSGWMFSAFGLKPAVGRLLSENDDQVPGAAPYAVLSYDYWTSRFGKDPSVVGRTFRIGNDLYQIIGVAQKSFTGTERGIFTQIFLPVMMHRWVTRNDSQWHRTLMSVNPGVEVEPLRQKLAAVSHAFELERAKSFTGAAKRFASHYVDDTVVLEPASSGASNLQNDYRKALGALGVLVAMVLLIACANVANLMTAQAAARVREMALRISIGAGRLRLVQLVLTESAMIAVAAVSLGAAFAWWAAPFVVSMINPPDDPAQLALPADWRVFAFSCALVFAVVLCFGLLPALRASSVKPVTALKGGDDPHARRRLMNGMIAFQVAFCFLVVFVSGLFVTTFERLANQSMGFVPDRLLLLETVAQKVQMPIVWEQMAARLREVPGVESASICGWPLLVGDAWNGFISVNGAQPTSTLSFFLTTSPGWLDTMKIHLLAGRDFRSGDTSPGQAMVNETFVKTFYGGESPIGKTFIRGDDRYTIVGVVADTPYRHLRERILPVAYVPFHEVAANGLPQSDGRAFFVLRMAGADPLALASDLRHIVLGEHVGLRVSNIQTQNELVRDQTLRERLLAMLALFFAGVALLLAGIGLFGVLSYSVLQRRREIGIRIAIGAQRGGIARLVTSEIFAMLVVGSVAGFALGISSARYIESLFYQVKATDAATLAFPALSIFSVALIATVPAVRRALETDPAEILRSE